MEQDNAVLVEEEFSDLYSFLRQSREADAIDNIKSVDRPDYYRTAMRFAAKFGRMIVLEYLVTEKEVGVEYIDLLVATQNSQVEAFRYLESNYDSESLRKDFDEIILAALIDSNQAFIEGLIDNSRFSNERILGYACEFGMVEIVKKILATDVDPSARNNKALREAVRSLNSEIMQLLLEYSSVCTKESIVSCVQILSEFEKGTRIPRDVIEHLKSLLPEALSLDDILTHIEAEVY